MSASNTVAPRQSVPVVTDATSASPAELAEAVSLFYPPHVAASVIATRASGGVNNKVYLVETESGEEKGVLRIYNNGLNRKRCDYEVEVLRQLSLHTATKPLSFKTPTLLPPLSPGDNGSPLVTLSTGAAACLFERMEGGGAPLTAARNIGRATAELVFLMGALHLDPASFPLPNPLYRNLWDAHHKVSPQIFAEVVALPACDAVRPDMDYLVAEIVKAELLIKDIMASGGLPEQQIHADLHFDNVLCVGDRVSGVLDLEFSARDWRVMELVVGLSKYCGLSAPESYVLEYCTGYGEGGGSLTAREAELVPDLVVLRILSNVVYFAGRAAAGEDSISPLSGRADVYAKRCKWLHEKHDWLVAVLKRTVRVE